MDYIQSPRKIKASGTACFRRAGQQATSPVWQIAAAAIVAMALLSGCAGPRLEPVAGPLASETPGRETGIHLTILSASWPGYPPDLSRYFTPIGIRIENQRTQDVQVRYEDFVALDDDRNQFRPVLPSEVARALTGTRRFEREPGNAPQGLLAGGPWYPYRDPFFPPYSPYWLYGPYYPYGWPQRTAQDILTLALREGSILPGASIQGFLYLQLATSRGNSLVLSWTPRDADGKPLEALSATFRIIR